MKRKRIRGLAMLTALLLAGSALAGCGGTKETALNGTAENDILTFQSNLDNRPIVRIGMQYYTPDNNLIAVLQERFPEYLFVMDYSPAAGNNAEQRLLRVIEKEVPLDLVISAMTNFKNKDFDYYVDLSAERFLDNYLLSALNGVSSDEHIYILPGVSSLTGIAYNTEMFAENGWEVPTNTEEFYALCETIKAAGIAPISHCFKYATQVNTMFGTMCYDKLFMSADASAWVRAVQTGDATYTGHMEPFFALAKRHYDAGLATIDSFTASLTKNREAFWAGEYAMIFYNSSIFTYAEAENAPFAVGIMPFPAESSDQSGYSSTPEYYIAIPKLVERDPERLALMKEILAFISTEAGQRAMLSGSLSVSNVKGVTMSDNPAYVYMAEAYERGNLYPVVEYSLAEFDMLGLQKDCVQTIFEGGSAEAAIAMMDEGIQRALSEGVPEPVFETLATAETDFTMLETSYYLADKLREASGADVGLMINGGYFRSNLFWIAEGEITSDLNQFVMKGVGAEDFLTTYKLTGAQLRALIEHPIVNGAEIDALIAASGLAIEYAPWNERGSRVRKLTLTDGTELADDALYTVAAWVGVIDERYITETVEAHAALGSLTDILAEAFKKDGTVRPDIADRVTLVWPEAVAQS